MSLTRYLLTFIAALGLAFLPPLQFNLFVQRANASIASMAVRGLGVASNFHPTAKIAFNLAMAGVALYGLYQNQQGKNGEEMYDSPPYDPAKLDDMPPITEVQNLSSTNHFTGWQALPTGTLSSVNDCPKYFTLPTSAAVWYGVSQSGHNDPQLTYYRCVYHRGTLVTIPPDQAAVPPDLSGLTPEQKLANYPSMNNTTGQLSAYSTNPALPATNNPNTRYAPPTSSAPVDADEYTIDLGISAEQNIKNMMVQSKYDQNKVHTVPTVDQIRETVNAAGIPIDQRLPIFNDAITAPEISFDELIQRTSPPLEPVDYDRHEYPQYFQYYYTEEHYNPPAIVTPPPYVPPDVAAPTTDVSGMVSALRTAISTEFPHRLTPPLTAPQIGSAVGSEIAGVMPSAGAIGQSVAQSLAPAIPTAAAIGQAVADALPTTAEPPVDELPDPVLPGIPTFDTDIEIPEKLDIFAYIFSESPIMSMFDDVGFIPSGSQSQFTLPFVGGKSYTLDFQWVSPVLNDIGTGLVAISTVSGFLLTFGYGRRD